DLQEPERRSRRAPDRGRRVEGRACRAGPHLGAARELHRERGRGTRRGREGADGRGPAGGVGAERGMAGARGPARRELVARLLGPRRNRRRGAGLGRRALRRALSVALSAVAGIGLVAVAAPPVRDAARRHPYFAVPEVVVRDHHRLPADEVRAAAGLTPGMSLLALRPSVPIELGWGGFAAKLARLPRVLGLWAGRETEIAEVNLQFDDEVIVRTQPARPAAAARRTI